MAHQSETLTDIPSFAKPLAPYIKSRQDALRIRQQLTLYLRSQLVFKDGDSGNHAQSHVDLCVPHDHVVDVKRIPPEVTGLRRKYLEAIQANVAARRRYEAASEKVNSTRLRGGNHEPVSDPNSELNAYLKLLRGRQQHAKLQVFQHYLEELKKRDVAGLEYIESQAPPQVAPRQIEGEPHQGSADIEGLVHKLERAVIRAKSQLDKEKKLFEEVKAQHESKGISHEDVPSAVKARALQRTRDELVQWIEGRLVNMGGGDDDPTQEPSVEELEEASKSLEEGKAQIATQYAAYVEARKNLLDVASKACQPVGTSPTKPQSPIKHSGTTAPEQVPSLSPIDVLAYTSENFLPLSKTQRALALQRSYQSGMISKEKANTLRMLNRLSGESHLLPDYPILAHQPRFKNAAAAIKSRRASKSREPPKPDEITSLAEAWAFASEAAGENEQDYVEQRIAMGDESAQNAEKTLRGVYQLLNQDPEDMREGQEEPSTDNWAGEAQTSQTKPSREKRPKGPWSALDGQVDV